MAWAFKQLAPHARASRYTGEQATSGGGVETIEHYGAEGLGFKVRTEVYEHDRGHYTDTETFIVAETHGLEDGVSLRFDYSGGAVGIAVDTGDSREREIAREFERIFERSPSDNELLNLGIRASMAQKRQQWAAALDFGHQILKHRPQDCNALLAVGAASAATGDLITAEIALTDLLAIESDHEEARHALQRVKG